MQNNNKRLIFFVKVTLIVLVIGIGIHAALKTNSSKNPDTSTPNKITNVDNKYISEGESTLEKAKNLKIGEKVGDFTVKKVLIYDEDSGFDIEFEGETTVRGTWGSIGTRAGITSVCMRMLEESYERIPNNYFEPDMKLFHRTAFCFGNSEESIQAYESLPKFPDTGQSPETEKQSISTVKIIGYRYEVTLGKIPKFTTTFGELVSSE